MMTNVVKERLNDFIKTNFPSFDWPKPSDLTAFERVCLGISLMAVCLGVLSVFSILGIIGR